MRFTVSGPLATSTTKRIIVPGEFFEVNEKNPFTDEKRTLPVYFHFPERITDAVRIRFPEGYGVESLPSTATFTMTDIAFYRAHGEIGNGNVTLRRDTVTGVILVPAAMYSELRSYYAKANTRDQEPLLLRAGTP